MWCTHEHFGTVDAHAGVRRRRGTQVVPVDQGEETLCGVGTPAGMLGAVLPRWYLLTKEEEPFNGSGY